MRYSLKSTTEEYRRLDIRDLERKRLLQSTGWTTLFWTVNGEPSGSISIFPHVDHVVLKYSYRYSDGDWQKKEYVVCYDFTRCNYGGERRWFVCPALRCGRRVAILYLAGMFVCRHCLDLSYESQREQPYGRALRRAQAIRMKLGGERFDSRRLTGEAKRHALAHLFAPDLAIRARTVSFLAAIPAVGAWACPRNSFASGLKAKQKRKPAPTFGYFN